MLHVIGENNEEKNKLFDEISSSKKVIAEFQEKFENLNKENEKFKLILASSKLNEEKDVLISEYFY